MSSETFETRFIRFFEDFVDSDGKFVYLDKVSSMYSDARTWMNVSVIDMDSYDTTLTNDVITNHKQHMKTMETVVYQKLLLVNPEYADSIKNDIEIRLTKLPYRNNIHTLEAENMDQLIQIDGTVIQRGNPLVRPTVLAFKCRECNFVTEVVQDEQYRKKPETRCPRCDEKKWRRNYELSTFEDYQEIVIQELMENVPATQSPDKIKVTLRGNMIRTCEPGETVTIVGVLNAFDQSSRSVVLELEYYVDALSIINKTDADTVVLTDEDIVEVKKLMKTPEHRENVVKSISPTIYGMDEIKEACAYQLCEGQEKFYGETRIRGQFHILMASPPGCGKSEIGNFMIKCHPKGRKAIGRGASGVGLTASVVKEGEKFVLKAGAMPLADNGFIFIDELDKMSETDSSAMHSGMEEQKIKIDKADISAELNTRCSILAGCNPIGGDWSPYKEDFSGLHDNGKGIPIPLLDRFALKFIIKTNVDSDLERKVVKHIMDVNRAGSIDVPYNIEMLTKIFAYARTIEVNTSEEITKRLSELYMTLFEGGKANNALMITRRQPYDLIRIAEASARLHGRNVTTMADANNALRVLKASLLQTALDEETGNIDLSKLYKPSGKQKSKKDQYRAVISLIKGYDETYNEGGIPETKLYELLEKRGIKMLNATMLLEDMETLSPPYKIFRQGKLIRVA